MLFSYLKLSFRLLARNPFFTAINVTGLSVGFAAFFGLWQFARTELQADQYHPNYERIARIGIDWSWTDDNKTWGHTVCGWLDPRSANQISEDFAEVESFLRIFYQSDFDYKAIFPDHGSFIVLSSENTDGSKTIFKETKLVYADSNLFSFFSIPLSIGNKHEALKEPHTIVLSESMARKYFGRKNPLGQLLILNGKFPLKVTGVFHDLPPNTHLDFDFVLSNVALLDRWNSYNWPCSHAYVLLRKGVDIREFERKIEGQKNHYLAELLNRRPNIKITTWVQALPEIAYSNYFAGDYFIPKSKSLLILFCGVAVLVLVMAWINYVNLTLARTSRRMKEIGVRKTAGAQIDDFAKQFLVESIFIHVISLGLAGTILQLVKTPFKLYLNIFIGNWNQDIGILTLAMLTGVIITGLYPVLMARRYTPRKLISINSTRTRSNPLPGILSTFQYTSSTVLLLCVIVVFFQLNFIFEKGFGVGKESIAVIEMPIVRSENFVGDAESFKDRLVSKGLVYKATLSNSLAGDDVLTDLNAKRSVDSEAMSIVSNGGVGENFLDFFDIKLLAGRNFKPGDQNVVLISKLAIKRFGFENPTNAVGEKIQVETDGTKGWQEAEVIGVIEDYPVKAFINRSETTSDYRGNGIGLIYKTYWLGGGTTPERLAVKLDTRNVPAIEKLFSETFPGNPFVFYFQDDHVNRHYNNEKTSRNQILFFTFLAIGICCLGFLGMITNKLTEKTKELGIRRVLGARLYHVAEILLSSSIKQVAIANLIGIPVAWYLIQQYLQKFSERITLQWWYFVLPFSFLIVTLFAAISSALWRAVSGNPAESLKSE